MSELAQFKEVHNVVLPSFNKRCMERQKWLKGEEVMSLRPEEEGTPQLIVDTSKISREKMGPPLMEQD